jgi:putative oxidoreductase
MEAAMIDARTAPYAALLLRVSLGVLLLAHGLLLKVLTFGVPGTVGYFQSIGYPGFFAYLVMLGEIGGGIALILGLWTRQIALLLLLILIGTTLHGLVT